MTANPSRVTLHELVGQTLPCSCEVTHSIPTQAVVLKPNALDEVAACCTRHLSGRHVMLVTDAHLYEIAAQRVSAALQDAGYQVEEYVVPASTEGKVTADDATIEAVRQSIAPSIDFLLAVGAGTVNDIAKLASFQAGLPYVTCPTAASVNGFTSAIAAIMSDGVKRTVPAHLPVAVIADTDIIATAPAVMRRAGLGDMISKPVSNADWKLTQLVKGGYYCETPLHLVDAADRACREHALAIGAGESAGIEALTQALLLSGFSMAVAGSSSPASGGEHLISHYWDMTAHSHGRDENLHGAQVGVATLVTAQLYECLQRLDPATINLATLREQYPTWEQHAVKLRSIHGPLSEEVLAEAAKKYLPVEQKESEWTYIRDSWNEIWAELSPLLVPSAAIQEILQAAGAPTTMHELGISHAELQTAFLHAKDIRGRYTVLDFASDINVLEGLCDEVLSLSGVLS